MNDRTEQHTYTIGNVVVSATHVYIARAVAEEAKTIHIPDGMQSGTIFYHGVPVRWHVIGAKFTC